MDNELVCLSAAVPAPATAMVLSPPASVRVEAPATAPAEYTHHQLIIDEFNCNRKQFIDTHKVVSHKQAAWAAAAVESLEHTCRYLDYHSQCPPLQPEDMPTSADSARMGEGLWDMRSHNAQVRYCYAAALADLHRDSEAVEQLRQVFDQCKQEKFRPNGLVRTAEWRRNFRAFLIPGEDVARGEDVALAAAEESSCIDTTRGIRPARTELQWLLSIHRSVLDKHNLLQARACSPIQDLKDADPWLVEGACGRYEVGDAWGSRGADIAVNVMAQARQGFARHLALTKAWQLEPRLPDPAYDMIAMTMANGGAPATRSAPGSTALVRRTPTNLAALACIPWGLPSRWGGSLSQMVSLGRECAPTTGTI